RPDGPRPGDRSGGAAGGGAQAGRRWGGPHGAGVAHVQPPRGVLELDGAVGGSRRRRAGGRGDGMAAGATPLTTDQRAGGADLLQGIRQSLTLAWRTLVQVRHNPWEWSDFSFQPIMFVLLFTFVFGGAIAGDWQAYLQFMLPGLLLQNMLFVTLYVAQGLNTDLTKGVFDRFRALPISRWAPLAGRIVADQVKQLWSIVLVLTFGFILGFRLGTDLLGLVGATVLLMAFALAFSWVSVLIGLIAKDPERVQ